MTKTKKTESGAAHAKKSKVTRARAKRASESRVPTESRVREISALMETGRWFSKVATELAEKWGVSVKTVQAASAEASRRLRSALNMEEQAASLAGCFDLAISLASEQGDARALVLATEAKAKALGLDKPQRVSVDVTGVEVPAAVMALDGEALVRFLRNGEMPGRG